MAAIVAFANDHAGLSLKEPLMALVRELGYETLNLGTDTEDSVDYPDYGKKVAEAVAAGEAAFGIAICGSGIGISIAANRIAGARAALCQTAEMAVLAREHNNANILCLGARLIGSEEAKECVTRFLQTDFAGGRHETRVTKLG